jgi:prepilin-type N-terminal cleavage/methylation domain-containing protein
METRPSFRFPLSPRAGFGPRLAFTLVEIMVAIGIFSLILAAIYSSWTAILRASKTGLEAAASAQRARITVRVLEDSLGSALSFDAHRQLHPEYYSFVAENGSEAILSFTTRLSKSFPRSGKFGDLDVRRVTFFINSAPDGTPQLVLQQNPLVMELDQDEKEHPIVLAKNVKGFEMQFWATDKTPPDWVDEWKEQKTNQLPAMVMVTLKLADNPHSSRVTEEITRIISLPSRSVQPLWQVPGGQGTPGAPGASGTPGNLTVPGGSGTPGTMTIQPP